MDLNSSVSASLLPPLAGGGKHENYNTNQTGSNYQSRNEGKYLPENFNLNLAESEKSVNFEFSDSKTLMSGTGLGFQSNDMSVNQFMKSRKNTQLLSNNSQKIVLRQEEEKLALSGSMKSDDFDISQSNFSMSKRSGFENKF